MPQEHEFAVAWTFRDPMTTVEYPRGWVGSLPADRLKAARDAGVLVVEQPPILLSDTTLVPSSLTVSRQGKTRVRKKAE